MTDPLLTRRRAVHAEHARLGHRGRLLAAAWLAVAILHLTFAASLITAGTEGERILALESAAISGQVADLGELPAIQVVGRRPA